MDKAVADLIRAIMDDDDQRIVSNLDKIGKARNRLVNELQAWRPGLRIAAAAH